MKKTMRVCAMGMAIMLIASVSMAQDVVGEWRGDTPQGEMIITIVKGADGTLAGTMDGGQAGLNDLSEVKFEDGVLSFVNRLEFNGQEFVMEYSGPVDGDTIDGTISVGDFGEFPLVITRKAAGSRGGAEGEWEISYEGRQGTQTATVKIAKGSDGSLSGTWTTQRGENELSNIKYDGGVLTFSRHVEFGGNSMDFSYSGTIDGDSIKGTMGSDRFGDRPFEGKRIGGVGGGLAAVLGDWTFSMQGRQGSREVALKLTETDGELAGTWEGFRGDDIAIENAKFENGKLTFEINFDTPNGSFGMSFEGTLDGDDLKGEMTTPRGSRPANGKRAQ